MDFWEIRQEVAKLIPRMSQFIPTESPLSLIKEKGRKVNYHQYDILSGEMKKKERLLNLEEMTNFIEVSLRSQGCPMSLNVDCWDGLTCEHACAYCFADNFRASLYTSFFDNGKSMSFRYCNPDYFKAELDKLMVHRGTNYSGDNGVIKAISLGMPIRLGIRFEDFLPVEKEKGVSLAFLKYLRSIEYPVMINTKSDLVGEDNYLEELSGNKAKSAVHITMISADEELMKKIESGAPSFKRRIQAAKNLVDAGIKVVARIEPFMLFINDNPDIVKEYVEVLKWAGVKSITLDSYSYSAYNMGIKNKFMSLGYDFDRMFTLMSDCQWLGSLVLGKFMEYLRSEGFSCSTFDFGNVPDNNDPVCCEVGKWFGTDHFCYGNIVSAIRFISSRGEEYATWGDYENHVINNGGFLTSQLQNEVKGLWNCIGNSAYFVDWGNGIIPYGMDKDGVVWAVEKRDFRDDLFTQIIGG